MFALEIDFHDGVSTPETLLVRRPHALVGTSDYAHVVIDGAASSLCELRITKKQGQGFLCEAVRRSGNERVAVPFDEGIYYGEAELHLGEVTTTITPLDVDLAVRPDESPDRAGVRILRDALSVPATTFPAIAVAGSVPIIVSFPATKPIIIGRSRKCGLRLDSSDVSSEHARVGFENGELWVEDLGSTNGTYVGDVRVSGRRTLAHGDTIRLGSDTMLVGLISEEDVQALDQRGSAPDQLPQNLHEYPCVVANHELIKPARLVLSPGSHFIIGRDPSSGIWVGAGHISRRHAELSCDADGVIELTDYSTNGTHLNGKRLEVGKPATLSSDGDTIGFGEDITATLCLSADAEIELIPNPRHAVPHENQEHTAVRAADPLADSAAVHATVEAGEDAASVAQGAPSETIGVAREIKRPGMFGRIFSSSSGKSKSSAEAPEYEDDSAGAMSLDANESDAPEFDRPGDFEQAAGFDDNIYSDGEFESPLDDYATLGPVGRFASFLAIIGLCGLIGFLIYTFLGGNF